MPAHFLYTPLQLGLWHLKEWYTETRGQVMGLKSMHYMCGHVHAGRAGNDDCYQLCACRHSKWLHALWACLALSNFIGCFINKFGPQLDPTHLMANPMNCAFAYILITGEPLAFRETNGSVCCKIGLLSAKWYTFKLVNWAPVPNEGSE